MKCFALNITFYKNFKALRFCLSFIWPAKVKKWTHSNVNSSCNECLKNNHNSYAFISFKTGPLLRQRHCCICAHAQVHWHWHWHWQERGQIHLCHLVKCPDQVFHLHLTFNLLNPYISINILHTVLYTSSKRLTRSICLTIKSFCKWWSFP